MKLFNREIALGFVLGILAVVLAIILLSNQYMLVNVAGLKCPCNNSFNISGNVLMTINASSSTIGNISILAYQQIPQTNITISQQYNYPVNSSTRYIILLNVKGLEVYSNSSLDLSIYLVKRPVFYYPLWIMMMIFFILALALIIVGFILLIEDRAAMTDR